jgi:hypothetical protein
MICGCYAGAWADVGVCRTNIMTMSALTTANMTMRFMRYLFSYLLSYSSTLTFHSGMMPSGKTTHIPQMSDFRR